MVVWGMAVERLWDVDQRIVVSVIVIGLVVVIGAAINWQKARHIIGGSRVPWVHEGASISNWKPAPTYQSGRMCPDCGLTTGVYETKDRGRKLARCTCGWREEHPEDIVDRIMRQVMAESTVGTHAVSIQEPPIPLEDTIPPNLPTKTHRDNSSPEISRYKATRPIEKVVSPRLASILRKHGIKSRGALSKAKARELRRIPGIGKDSMQEIRDVLDAEGIKP